MINAQFRSLFEFLNSCIIDESKNPFDIIFKGDVEHAEYLNCVLECGSTFLA